MNTLTREDLVEAGAEIRNMICEPSRSSNPAVAATQESSPASVVCMTAGGRGGYG